MDDFRIAIDEWTGAGNGSPEEIATRGLLCIEAGGICLSRNENSWSRSVSDRVHVSMYPAALWLVANWWRLCFEAPRWSDVEGYDWRASHELPAAGGGYLWPRLRFTPDGESVLLEGRPSRQGSKEPVRYLEQARVPVTLRDFERACESFVATVIARLREQGIRATPLESTWGEVCAERGDSTAARERRFEAMLHCDPDQAPVDAIAALEKLAGESGLDASVEIAGALCSDGLLDALEGLRSAGENGTSLRARWDRADRNEALAACGAVVADRRLPPWLRGRGAARALRAAWGIAHRPITSDQFEVRLGLERGTLGAAALPHQPPVVLAIEKGSELRLLLRACHPRRRRFEVARLLGDLVASGRDDVWHPVTELHTARQQFQRAFAAEFLCPVAGLEQLLGSDCSEDAIAAAADHFDVTELTVEHQVANNLRRRRE
ncbi:MAG: hypothetical protein FJ265_15790 [Planctomycetes bacterium]|nr:hypothetical protein [Planctomycetota bacterium]